MAGIKILEIRPTGSELFHDSESFLNELSHLEAGIIQGGEVAPVILLGSILLENIAIQSIYSLGISKETASILTSA
ncbi:hypothetical protein HCG51_06685 [Tolypothrix sp. PCC 7910]|uniref:hypothetical protein n=1 Tax=Tolypothrix sp. PCC 7910 TaxID=2099387 RepID=UPI0014277040|nr:hypothetical protein [Tolypothrix sp. PCC 7910]QIR35268.1 hypothetical protein HCG51_06685 [Tolypothrix sp. PCC 7910]